MEKCQNAECQQFLQNDFTQRERVFWDNGPKSYLQTSSSAMNVSKTISIDTSNNNSNYPEKVKNGLVVFHNRSDTNSNEWNRQELVKISNNNNESLKIRIKKQDIDYNLSNPKKRFYNYDINDECQILSPAKRRRLINESTYTIDLSRIRSSPEISSKTDYTTCTNGNDTPCISENHKNWTATSVLLNKANDNISDHQKPDNKDTKKELKRNYQVYNNENSCIKCGKPWSTFQDEISILNHIKTKHKYACHFNQCSLQYTRLQLLKEHQEKTGHYNIKSNNSEVSLLPCFEHVQEVAQLSYPNELKTEDAMLDHRYKKHLQFRQSNCRVNDKYVDCHIVDGHSVHKNQESSLKCHPTACYLELSKEENKNDSDTTWRKRKDNNKNEKMNGQVQKKNKKENECKVEKKISEQYSNYLNNYKEAATMESDYSSSKNIIHELSDASAVSTEQNDSIMPTHTKDLVNACNNNNDTTRFQFLYTKSDRSNLHHFVEKTMQSHEQEGYEDMMHGIPKDPAILLDLVKVSYVILDVSKKYCENVDRIVTDKMLDTMALNEENTSLKQLMAEYLPHIKSQLEAKLRRSPVYQSYKQRQQVNHLDELKEESSKEEFESQSNIATRHQEMYRKELNDTLESHSRKGVDELQPHSSILQFRKPIDKYNICDETLPSTIIPNVINSLQQTTSFLGNSLQHTNINVVNTHTKQFNSNAPTIWSPCSNSVTNISNTGIVPVTPTTVLMHNIPAILRNPCVFGFTEILHKHEEYQKLVKDLDLISTRIEKEQKALQQYHSYYNHYKTAIISAINSSERERLNKELQALVYKINQGLSVSESLRKQKKIILQRQVQLQYELKQKSNHSISNPVIVRFANDDNFDAQKKMFEFLITDR